MRTTYMGVGSADNVGNVLSADLGFRFKKAA
jgi:hypothetical protein